MKFSLERGNNMDYRTLKGRFSYMKDLVMSKNVVLVAGDILRERRHEFMRGW